MNATHTGITTVNELYFTINGDQTPATENVTSNGATLLGRNGHPFRKLLYIDLEAD